MGPTLIDFAKLADRVYEGNNQALEGWTPQEREISTNGIKRAGLGMLVPGYFTGFQGVAYQRSNHIVVAFKGTKPTKTGDLTADAKIGLTIIPNQASSALNFFEQVRKAHGSKYEYFLVGHSLGGGLAQVVGFWTDVPFVSFNAPGMLNCLRTAKFNLAKPMVMGRTREKANEKGLGADNSGALNVRLKGDLVSSSKLSKHYGHILELMSPESSHLKSHLMEACLKAVSQSVFSDKTLSELLAVQSAGALIAG